MPPDKGPPKRVRPGAIHDAGPDLAASAATEAGEHRHIRLGEIHSSAVVRPVTTGSKRSATPHRDRFKPQATMLACKQIHADLTVVSSAWICVSTQAGQPMPVKGTRLAATLVVAVAHYHQPPWPPSPWSLWPLSPWPIPPWPPPPHPPWPPPPPPPRAPSPWGRQGRDRPSGPVRP